MAITRWRRQRHDDGRGWTICGQSALTCQSRARLIQNDLFRQSECPPASEMQNISLLVSLTPIMLFKEVGFPRQRQKWWAIISQNNFYVAVEGRISTVDLYFVIFNCAVA